MTKMMLMAAVGTLVSGCGPDFAGIYDGNVVETATCSDGSGGTTSVAVTWTIADRNAALTIAAGGTCDPLTAKAKGNVATIDTKVCPSSSSGGLTFTQTAEGSLVLDDASLTVSLLINTAITGQAIGSCASRATGILIHRPR